jgi:tetratricopeptide (TPR) repeat protein
MKKENTIIFDKKKNDTYKIICNTVLVIVSAICISILYKQYGHIQEKKAARLILNLDKEYSEGGNEAVVKTLSKAIALEQKWGPGDRNKEILASYYQLRGSAHEQEGNYQAALDDYETAFKLNGRKSYKDACVRIRTNLHQ